MSITTAVMSAATPIMQTVPTIHLRVILKLFVEAVGVKSVSK